MPDLAPDQQPDFCVRIDFKKGTPNPERVFRSAAAFIETLQEIDELLIVAVDSKIKPVLLLEQIEAGSIRIWLKTFLEAVDDEALKKLDWRPAVGKYLVKAKHKIIEHVEDKKELGNREELESLALGLHQLAEATDALAMPAYRHVSPSDLAYSLRKVSESISDLEEGDVVTIESDEGRTSVSPDLVITKENIAEILAGQSISNPAERILKVRKPDFLGNSMWEFRHQNKSFPCRILDEQWLADFRSGAQVITPGDALRVKVYETTTYGTDGEVLDESRVITQVLGIIREHAPKLPID